MYSYGHPGSSNPTVITNKEAHMIYGNFIFTNVCHKQNKVSLGKYMRDHLTFD